MCWGSSASLIVDLTFHGQWGTSQVQRQPPCTARFACVGSNPSLANCIDATCENVMARYKNYSSKLRHRFCPFWPDFTDFISKRWQKGFYSRSPIHGSVWKKSSFLRGRREFRSATSVISQPGFRIGCHAYRRLTEKWEGLNMPVYFDRLSQQM